MPTVTLNRNVLEKLTGKKMSLEKLKDRISYLGTDLDRIEANDIHVEVFPNRPDMLSEQGFARALSSFIGVHTGIKKYNVKKSGMKVVVKDLPEEWPYAVACIVKGIKFDDEKIKEVIQLQEKLGTTLTRNRRKGGLGLYPLDKINFPITFVGKNPEEIKFRPLEFIESMNGKQILSRHPKGKEYGHIMDGWSSYPVFIDSKSTIMSMPPIINSHDVGKIDATTRDVFIEGTGPDLNTIKISLAILATSLADMGGEIHSLEMVYQNNKFQFPDLEPEKMSLDIDYVNKLLGLKLNKSEIKHLLERMGLGFENGSALIPKYRADILHPMDLVEDIAIAYGYENFEPEMSKASTIGEENQFEVFKNKVANIMVGLGYLETVNYHLSNENEMNKKMLVDIDNVKLINASSGDYNILRSWITPNLLKVLSENTRYDYPQKIFEIGTVFKKSASKETGVEEFDRLSCISCHKDANYTEIRQIIDSLVASLGLESKTSTTKHNSFIDGRVARVSVSGKDIAYVGELHPEVLSNFGLGHPASSFEINLTELFEILKK